MSQEMVGSYRAEVAKILLLLMELAITRKKSETPVREDSQPEDDVTLVVIKITNDFT